jgi:hypothetical protein
MAYSGWFVTEFVSLPDTDIMSLPPEGANGTRCSELQSCTMRLLVQTFPDRRLRVRGLEKFVEIEIQQQLPGISPALHDGCGGQ